MTDAALDRLSSEIALVLNRIKKDGKDRKTLQYWLKRNYSIKELWKAYLEHYSSLEQGTDIVENYRVTIETYNSIKTHIDSALHEIDDQIGEWGYSIVPVEKLEREKERFHTLRVSFEDIERSVCVLVLDLCKVLKREEIKSDIVDSVNELCISDESAIQRLERAIDFSLEGITDLALRYSQDTISLKEQILQQDKEIKSLKKLIAELEEGEYDQTVSCLQETQSQVDIVKLQSNLRDKDHLLELQYNRIRELETRPKRELNKMTMSSDCIIRMVNECVPLFYGRQGPNIHNEVKVFIDCCNVVSKEIPREKLDLFKSYLRTRFRGEAYDLINGNTFNDVDELATILYKAYLPTVSLRDLRNEMETCVQKPDEDIEIYGERLKKTLTRAKSAADTLYAKDSVGVLRELEEQAVLIFKAKVTSETLRRHLMAFKGSTLDSFIKEAIEYRRQEISIESQSQKGSQSNYMIEMMERLRKLELSHSMNNINRNNDSDNNRRPRPHNFAPPDRYQANRNLECFSCGGRGHIQRNCIAKRNQSFCSKCKKYGHTAYACKERIGFTAMENQGFSGFCDFCRSNDHKADNCLKRYLHNIDDNNKGFSEQQPTPNGSGNELGRTLV